MKEWDFNGENTLMTNNIINIVDHSLLCLIDSQVLDSEKFIEIKDIIINLNLKARYDFLKRKMIFKNLDSIIKHNIEKKMETMPYKKDVIIIKNQIKIINLYI